MFLDNVRVPRTALIGPSGEGWAVLREGMTLERLFTCGAYIGGFETVVDMVLDYGSQREQFGRSIGEFRPFHIRSPTCMPTSRLRDC